MRIRLGYGDGTWEQIEFDGTLHMAVKRFMLGANDRKCMEVELIDPEFEEEFGCIWSLKKVFYPSEEMIQRIATYYRLYIIKEWVSGPRPGDKELICGYIK